MNKDKMSLEEAIKKLQLMEYKYTLTENDDRAIEVVLDNLSNKNKRIIRLAKIIKELKQDNYKLDRENQKLFEIHINSIPKKKIQDKIDEQIEYADSVLIKENYINNFNGSKENQKHYFSGYKDASLFIKELLED